MMVRRQTLWKGVRLISRTHAIVTGEPPPVVSSRRVSPETTVSSSHPVGFFSPRRERLLDEAKVTPCVSRPEFRTAA